MPINKTLTALRREVNDAKNGVRYAEIHFGFNSAERNEAVRELVSAQRELGQYELAEIEARHAARRLAAQS